MGSMAVINLAIVINCHCWKRVPQFLLLVGAAFSGLQVKMHRLAALCLITVTKRSATACYRIISLVH